MIALLTDSEALAQPTLTHRFKVELASDETVLDCKGIPVPAHFKTLDVCVTEPHLEAITELLQASGHLDGWSIVSHWIPEDCDCF